MTAVATSTSNICALCGYPNRGVWYAHVASWRVIPLDPLGAPDPPDRVRSQFFVCEPCRMTAFGTRQILRDWVIGALPARQASELHAVMVRDVAAHGRPR